MKHLISLAVLGGGIYFGWQLVRPILNPFGIDESAPLGRIEKIESYLQGYEMYSIDATPGVMSHELPNVARFNEQPRSVIYVAGTGSVNIILPQRLGGGTIPEFVAIAADEEGVVQMLVVRCDPNPPFGASGHFAHDYWSGVTGMKPFFSPGKVDVGDGEKSTLLVARPTVDGIDGQWRRLIYQDFVSLYVEK